VVFSLVVYSLELLLIKREFAKPIFFLFEDTVFSGSIVNLVDSNTRVPFEVYFSFRWKIMELEEPAYVGRVHY
jgi:hypothetical protein